MRRALMLVFVIALAAGAATRGPNWRAYRHRAVGKHAVARSAARGGINHLRHSPHQWGGGPGGLAARVGSSLGQHAVKTGIEMGVGALHHENLHYHRSNLHGT